MSTNAAITCAACQTSEVELASNSCMMRLTPCAHHLCKDCHTSPLVLVSCYGCPACSLPTEVAPVVRSLLGAGEEDEEEDGEEWGAALHSATVTPIPEAVEEVSASFNGFSAASSVYYNFTTFVVAHTEESYPMAVTPKVVDPTSGLGSAATLGEEEKEEETFSHFPTTTHECTCDTSSSSAGLSSSEDSSTTGKKRRRQKKPVRMTEAKKFAVPAKPKVVVPAGCPDDQRPKTKPESKNAQQRTSKRELLLWDLHKDREVQKRRTKSAIRYSQF